VFYPPTAGGRKGKDPILAFWILRYDRRMKNQSLERDLVTARLEHLVTDLFRPDLIAPEGIAAQAGPVGAGLGLDPSEVFELALCIEEEFGVAVCDRPDTDWVFQSIASLAGLILAGPRIEEAAGRDLPAVHPNLTEGLAARA
jgi:hypothetical protein